jgi:hypothetical protein
LNGALQPANRRKQAKYFFLDPARNELLCPFALTMHGVFSEEARLCVQRIAALVFSANPGHYTLPHASQLSLITHRIAAEVLTELHSWNARIVSRFLSNHHVPGRPRLLRRRPLI